MWELIVDVGSGTVWTWGRAWPAATLAIVGLSGCWLQPGYGPERRNHNPFEQSLTEANAGSLSEAWSTPSASGGQPLVAGATVYTGQATPVAFTVEATDRRTGALRWQRQWAGSSPGAGAVVSVAGGEVLAARLLPSFANSTFEELDPATGTTTSSVDVPEWLDASTLTSGEGVVAYRALQRVGGFGLVVRDRATFDLLFTAPGSTFSLGEGDPAVIAGGRVLVREDGPSGDPEIRIYDVAGCGAPTCSPVATLPVPPPPASTGYVSYSARLLAVTDDGHLLLQRWWSAGLAHVDGIDLVSMAPDGTLDWSVPLDVVGQSGGAGVATAGDAVFAVGIGAAAPAGGGLMLARTGGIVWHSDAPVAAVAPVLAGGLVYVGGDVFDAAGCGAPTCAPLVSLDVGTVDGIDGASVSNGTLLVNEAGPDGHLLAFRPDPG